MAGRVAERLRATALPAEGSLSSVFSALADPVRLRILALLRQREQCVCHLTKALGLSQSTISHHIRMLKQAGLVRDRRDPGDSRWVYCRLNLEGVAALRAMLQATLDTTALDPAPVQCSDDNDSLDRDDACGYRHSDAGQSITNGIWPGNTTDEKASATKG